MCKQFLVIAGVVVGMSVSGSLGNSQQSGAENGEGPTTIDAQAVVDIAGRPDSFAHWNALRRDNAQHNVQLAMADDRVDHKHRVLLFAGGPVRDYRYLQAVLLRDRAFDSHVLLQTARRGASQDADKVLAKFPATREELSQYDCIVAFDPDWQALDEQQIDLLQSWVSDQAGGLILIGGQVNLPRWAARADDAVIAKVERLYPVKFKPHIAGAGRSKPWPLKLSESGQNASFLQLADDPPQSKRAWEDMPGVYQFCRTEAVKPAATVYAHYADPATKTEDGWPVYLASHSFGGGRVFFQAGAEIWRTRSVDTEYFGRYYLQLIRWAATGRNQQDRPS